MLAPRTSPRLKPVRRKTLASPCHSPYGASRSAVSPGSGQRRRSEARSLTSARSSTRPGVVAAEPLQRDDSDRPRADAPLAPEPLERVVVGAEPVEVDRPREPRERGGSAAREPARRDASRRQARQSLARRRILAARADDRPLDLERARGLDQLSAHAADHGVGHGCLAPRAHPAEPPDGRADERVARVEPVELARVVVEREHEPRVLDAELARGADDDLPVVELPRRRPASVGQLRVPRIGAGGEPERVRADRPQHRFDHRVTHPTGPRGPDTSTRCGSPTPSRSARAGGSSSCSSTSCDRTRTRRFSTSEPTSSASARATAAERMNFFEEHYPWPERITALGLHDGAGFRGSLPRDRVRAG